MTDFINSRLGNLVESNRGRIQEFTDKAESQTKELSRTADAHNSRYNLASSRSARKYGTPVDIARLLKELYEQGYYGNIAYNKAVDGIWGKLTQDAYNRRRLGKPDKLTTSDKQRTDTVAYIHYPNFYGLAANAVKVGSLDVGKAVLGKGNILPVGHDELISFDKDGNASLIRYGRYKTGIGHVRPTTKGGNWNIIKLPKKTKNESVKSYVTRIKDSLEDSKYGKFEVISVPNVNSKDVLNYAITQANDSLRPEYCLSNTCATGATNALKAGLSEEDIDRMDKFPSKIFGGAEKNKEVRAWGLIPGSTNQYTKKVRNIGKSQIIR